MVLLLFDIVKIVHGNNYILTVIFIGTAIVSERYLDSITVVKHTISLTKTQGRFAQFWNEKEILCMAQGDIRAVFVRYIAYDCWRNTFRNEMSYQRLRKKVNSHITFFDSIVMAIGVKDELVYIMQLKPNEK